MIKNLVLILICALLFFGTIKAFVLGIPFVFCLLKRDELILNVRYEKEVLIGFKDALSSIKTALRAGYSLENAVGEAIKDIEIMYGEDAVIVREFYRISNEIALRIPVEKAFENFAKRWNIEDIRNFAAVLVTAKRTGGDLISITDNTASIISEKIEIESDIKTAIAAKELEWKIMTAIPFFIILYMKFCFPQFMTVLYTTWAGRIVMTAALSAVVGAYLWGQKILKIEV